MENTPLLTKLIQRDNTIIDLKTLISYQEDIIENQQTKINKLLKEERSAIKNTIITPIISICVLIVCIYLLITKLTIL